MVYAVAALLSNTLFLTLMTTCSLVNGVDQRQLYNRVICRYIYLLAKEDFFMQKKTVRVATNQPGVYKNLKTGKYDVKYRV